jgi:hypothetical protein
MIQAIDEIEYSDFNQTVFSEHYNHSEPLIVRNFNLHAGIRKNWRLDYLSGFREFGEKQLPVFAYNKKDSQWDTFYCPSEHLHMPLSEAFEGIFADPEKCTKYLNIFEVDVPELLDTVELPGFIAAKTVQPMKGNFWAGTGNVTHLHLDSSNNFYFQVVGKKTFILFEPVNYNFLYPKAPHLSEFRYVQDVDPEKFPLFRFAKKIEVTLNPGDFLYLPPFWWHQVETFNPYVSVNYWGYPHVGQCLCQAGRLDILIHFEMGTLLNVLEQLVGLRYEKLYSYREMCMILLFNCYNWVAGLLLAALLEKWMLDLCRENGLELNASFNNRLEDLRMLRVNYQLDTESLRNSTLAVDRLEALVAMLTEKSLLSAEMYDTVRDAIEMVNPAKRFDNVSLPTALILHLTENIFSYMPGSCAHFTGIPLQ